VNKPPIRIYLDQKDFSEIAHAVRRGDQQAKAFVAYQRLQAHVDTGRVRVYYSFVHIVEALRFGNPRSEVVVAYCDIVDSLTQGHCIRFRAHLERAELALALADVGGSSSNYSKDSYPYGRYGEAVTSDGLSLDPRSFVLQADRMLQSNEELRAELKRQCPNRHAIRSLLRHPPPDLCTELEAIFKRDSHRVLEVVLTGSDEQRRALAAEVMGDPTFLRSVIAEVPDDHLDKLNEQFPAGVFRWTRDLIAVALAGSPDEKSRILAQFFDGIMSFKQLVTYYSATRPELANMGATFDAPSSQMVAHLRLAQQFEPTRAAAFGQARWDKDIAEDIGAGYLDEIRDQIRTYADQTGLSAETVERQLRAEGFKRLPYQRARIMWIHSYLARHKGTKHQRTPDENDFRDFLHCINAPSAYPVDSTSPKG